VAGGEDVHEDGGVVVDEVGDEEAGDDSDLVPGYQVLGAAPGYLADDIT